MRFKLILLLIALLSFSKVFSQNWGTSTFSQTINEASDIETNNLGEHYVVGYYSGQTSFGVGTSISSSQGNTDAYIAKYNANGEVIWVKNFGGILADRAVDLAIGPDQNIVVTGHFFGTVTFGSTTFTSLNNSKDIFLMKLDPAGNILWVKQEGGNMADNSNKLAIDSQNNIILTGEFQGSTTIAGTSLTSMTNPSTSGASFDFFVAKYNAAGTGLWAVSGQASEDDKGLSVYTDNANNIFFIGQFSNDMTFGSTTYTNTSLNIGFVSKLNPNGNVQFFHMLRAGLVTPYDIKINSVGEALLTGDFQGNLNYIAGATTIITNPYPRKIFTIKIANNGQYIWGNTLGSNNELSARALAIDPSNQIYVTGFFRCDLSQIQDTTKNLFNSVGYRDPYLMKLSNGGSRLSIKQFGGKLDDEGKGVTCRVANKPIICGSYTSDLNFTYNGTASVGFNNFTFNQFFGITDPTFLYLVGDQSRNSFLTNHIDNNYEDYDYFKVQAGDSLEGYIRDQHPPVMNVSYANDTVHFCSEAILEYETQTWPFFGPDYIFNWNTGGTSQTEYINTQNNYWVTVTRLDGCKVEVDSVFAKKETSPTLPLLTDNQGQNVNQPGPLYNTIETCYPDDAIITFSNLPSNTTLVITDMYGTSVNGPGPHTLIEDSTYIVSVSNEYCTVIGSFDYFQYNNTTVDPIDLSIVPDKPVLPGDTIKICLYDFVEFHGIDLITNPSANFLPQIPHYYDTLFWTIDGQFEENYDTATVFLIPSVSGWHSITLNVVIGYDNFCGTDTAMFTFTKNYYIQVLPLPGSDITIAGPTELCPNSSAYLVASQAHPSLSWSGANIVWNNNADSIEVNAPGWYNYGGILIDQVTGCNNYLVINKYVSVKVAPTITLLPGDGIICPNDSVLMTVPSSFSSYLWLNQNGDTISTSASCYTDEIGEYSCRVTDASGCSMWTTPVEVFQYATPTLEASGGSAICDNETVEVEIVYSGNANFVWTHDGSTSNILNTNTPGTYYVQITQCGSTTLDSIVILDGAFTAQITVSDSVLCFGEVANFTGSVAGTYDWNNGASTTNQYSTTTAGAYHALVTNIYGCTAQTNTINIITVPDVSSPNVPSYTICSGDDVTLTEDNTTILNWYSLDSVLVFNGASLTLTNIQQDTSFLVAYTTSNPLCGINYQQVDITFTATLESFTVLGDSVLCPGEDGLFTATTNDPVEWFIGGTSLGTNNPITIPYNQLVTNPVFSVSTSNICFNVTIQDSVLIVVPTAIVVTPNPVSICFKETETVQVTNSNIQEITWTGDFGNATGSQLTLQGNQSYGLITISGFDQHGCPAIPANLQVNTGNYSMDTTLSFASYCDGINGSIQVTTTSDSIRWITPTGYSNANPLFVTLSDQTAGQYILQTWDEYGCLYHDTLFIPVISLPNLNISGDTTLCKNEVFYFQFPTDENNYFWEDYGTQTSFPLTGDLTLILHVENQAGCIGTDTIFIEVIDCDAQLPNIITPNGDGINEFFIIDKSEIQPNNRLIIFNRWGNTIFEAAPYTNNFNGFDCVDGVYFYRYFPDRDKNESESGFLTIIR